MSSLRPANSFLLLLVGNEAKFLAVAREAASLAFSHVAVTTCGRLEDALRWSEQGELTLLVLDQPTEVDRAKALDAKAVDGLPRWVVVTQGSSPARRWADVAPADWNAPLVAKIFQAAVAEYRLQKENARFRGDLASIGTRIAHDLRSPLGGVLTTAEVLREVLAEDGASSRPNLAEPLIESAEGLTKLIRQLSLITKAAAQTVPLAKLNMGAPFWAAMQQVERPMLAKGATITHPDVWPDVMGDATWLVAAWQNLLLNAIEHTGPAPRIEAGWDRIETENRFWLRDGGSVPEEKRGRLFQPFHLLHQPNAPRGLGLPIVQRLVELQGGRCGYEPRNEGGSCFFFILPVVPGGAPT